MASTPVDGIGLVSCDVFMVRGACACVLVDGARSRLSRAVQCRLVGLESLWVQYVFGQSFLLWQCCVCVSCSVMPDSL